MPACLSHLLLRPLLHTRFTFPGPSHPFVTHRELRLRPICQGTHGPEASLIIIIIIIIIINIIRMRTMMMLIIIIILHLGIPLGFHMRFLC